MLLYRSAVNIPIHTPTLLGLGSKSGRMMRMTPTPTPAHTQVWALRGELRGRCKILSRALHDSTLTANCCLATFR